MTYNPSIPQANDIISQSQGQILTNFNQANTIFDVDHVTFDNATVANRGKHDKSTYVELAADPVTAFNEVAVYSKDTGTQPDVFVRLENNGTVERMTGGGITAAAYCSFVGATGALQANSFNVTGVVRPFAGQYTVTFTRPFTNANYVAVVSWTSPFGGGVNDFRRLGNGGKAAGTYTLQFENPTNAFADPVQVDIVFFGVLA